MLEREYVRDSELVSENYKRVSEIVEKVNKILEEKATLNKVD